MTIYGNGFDVVTTKSYDNIDAIPNNYEFTEYPKIMFGMVAMGLVFVGMLVYSKEK